MRAFVVTTLVALVAAIAASAVGGQTAGGLRGIVWKGPVRPVCEEDVACNRPAAGVTLVFSRAGQAVKRTTTGPQGWYHVRLAPGAYNVSAARRLGFGVFGPRAVRVMPGRISRVDFYIDTGIR